MDFINDGQSAPQGVSINDATLVDTLAGPVTVPLLVVCAFEGGAPQSVLDRLWSTLWAKDYPGALLVALVFGQMAAALADAKRSAAIAEATRRN